MDPLSITASVLTLITAAIVTLTTLNETVGHYKGRDKTLARLQGGLTDLISMLKALEEAADDETPIMALLKGPVARCAQVAQEFEEAMRSFSGRSKPGLKDWAKMEFMRSDINEFIDTLADYKSTITIGLGTITMNASRITKEVVADYTEMIKDTIYSLEMRLQRIDDKLAVPGALPPATLEDSSINLQDEKAVTIQCIRICKRATSYLTSLQEEQPILEGKGQPQGADHVLKQFESQLLTQRTLNESRANLLETIGNLLARLDSATLSGGGTDRESETLRLRQEIDYSKQCLEVCREVASQVSNQKIHIIGEVIADEDCDQVVVTTLADLFHTGKVQANKRSMQLVGSMQDATLQEISKDRYGSRFGARDGNLAAAQMDKVVTSPSIFETPKSGSTGRKASQGRENLSVDNLEESSKGPSSNEVRKRKPEDGRR